jgi:hypothetical protein
MIEIGSVYREVMEFFKSPWLAHVLAIAKLVIALVHGLPWLYRNLVKAWRLAHLAWSRAVSTRIVVRTDRPKNPTLAGGDWAMLERRVQNLERELATIRLQFTSTSI